MKEMRRLIFGGIVSLVMALLLIPGTAFAEENVCQIGETGYASLETAIGEAGDGATIKMLQDVTLNETVTFSDGKTFTLDLNGKGIVLSEGANSTKAIKVADPGTKLTICDSSTEKTGKIETKKNNASVRILSIENSASAELQSGSIVAEDADVKYEIYPANGTTFTMTGGEIRSGNSAWALLNQGEINFDGGKIYADGAKSLNSSYIDKAANILVHEHDGAFVVQPRTQTAPADFHVKYGDWFYDCFGTISDVSNYTPYKNNDGIIFIEVNKDGSGAAPSITLSSGTIDFTLNEGVQLTAGDNQIKLSVGTTVLIRGEGTAEPNAFALRDSAANYELTSVTKDGVTTYTPTKPTYYSVGEERFIDLQDAISAAAEGATITLLRNATQEKAVTIPEDAEITLDLSGYMLTMSGHTEYVDGVIKEANEDSAAFSPAIINKGTLTIKNGEITTAEAADVIVNTGVLDIASDAKISNTYARLEYRDIIANIGGDVETAGELSSAANNVISTFGGKVSITDGRLATTARAATTLAIYNRGYNNESEGAEVNISGGEFKSGTYAASVNAVRSGGNNPSNLTITGGNLESHYTAIYWPGAGTLTIGSEDNTDEPVITSINGSAVEVCCGTLNIHGGILNGGTEMAETGTTTSEELVTAFRNNSGASNVGDAITLVARRGDGYTAAPIDISITGGTFNSTQNYGVRYLDCNQASGSGQLDQDVSVEIINGSFTGVLGAVDAEYVAEGEKDLISGGTFSSDVTNYVKAGKISVKFANDNNTIYYVGAQTQINGIVKNAAAGDKIDVLQGDVALDIPAADVEVTNSGAGEVSVNGEPVTAGGTIMTEGQAPTDPENPGQPGTGEGTGSNQEGATGQAGNTGEGSSSQQSAGTATGDDFNMTVMIAVMFIAAAAAAGTVVYGRRKRNS